MRYVFQGHFVRGDVTDFDRRPLSGVTIYLLTTSSTVNIDCTRIPEAAKMNVRIPPPLIVENVYPACQVFISVFDVMLCVIGWIFWNGCTYPYHVLIWD